MIIDFTFENFTSFRDEASFSMMKTLERQHNDHIAVIQKYNLKLLPTGVIFGGNAAGKSNFVHALSYMQETVLDRIKIYNFFLLDEASKDKETVFTIKFLTKEVIYELSFSIFNSSIIKESLKKITTSKEIFLYKRSERLVQLRDYFNDKEILTTLIANADGTRINQLFLNNVIKQNKKNKIEGLDDFKNVFEWFKSKLYIISANDAPINNPFHSDEINQLIHDFDLGFVKNFNNTHKDISLPLKLETNGSKRILYLLQVLVMLLKQDIVWIIDDLTCNLHTLLAQKFIRYFLERCSNKNRSQLIFTTHDTNLMDQGIFRRDELWIVNRNLENASEIFSLSEYKDIRNDDDIQKSYLNGRFGGVPRVIL